MRPSPGYGRGMSPVARSMVLSFVAVATWLALGTALAFNADGAWWSAALLFAEPFLFVATAVAVVALVLGDEALIGLGLALGAGAFALLVRVPRPGSSQVDDTPPWIADAQNCAGRLELPTGSFTLLQWTLDPSVSDEEVVDVVRRAAPDVVVLHDIPRLSTADVVQLQVGGESRVVGAERPFGIFTRGVFHLCGEDALLLPLRPDDTPYALAFIGTPDGASFPLLAGALPPLTDPDWADGAREQRLVLGSLIGALQSSKLVVALDTRGPWTWTRINARFAAVGMRLVWSPADWPRRIAGVPWLPVHAMQRVWVGPAWQPIDTMVMRSAAGTRAPIVTVVDTVIHAVEPAAGEGPDGG